jgi:hypothetical protein
VDEWLTAARDAVAEAAGIERDDLAVDRDKARTLLELAAIAAHESGQRTNAPLLSYMLGRASRDAELEALAEALRSLSADK